MNRHGSLLVVVAKLAVSVVVIAVLLAAIAQTVQRPVSGGTKQFSSEFVDANGLKSGDDVRMNGVRIGKVLSISLEDGRAIVTFMVERDRHLYENTVLAIRYQSLVGQRYVDVQQSSPVTAELAAGSRIGASRTIPSFDITALFNGLEPVLSELSPAAVNKFATNMIAAIEGDGSGIGSVLDSIQTLSSYTMDRQAVITALVANLKKISDHLGGRSSHLVQLVSELSVVVSTLRSKVDGIVEFALMAPDVIAPLNSLLDAIGLTPGSNPDADTLLRTIFPDPQQAVEVLRKLPAMLQTLNSWIPSDSPVVNRNCSNGNVNSPDPFQVMITGQRISICKG
ncbi:MCE family protein [Nocardia ignorata]|uniref:Phospholipid/cholesterol/gamma-HCH transport system substrate-binding protein n=1 Tax=Nocardia ignorata TaxID=145285 RepID=A0A4R6P647_NOCIG|nr:MCE family protein [Nocardia ignorata]TDP31449.1 phospholipid/cholesterol/gamma-HCH transport system substrate-binding protein [Nocardia ignorata]